eukprot:scaffold442_cov268-Pinguiococcus_pyrenoidosus.AAC.106
MHTDTSLTSSVIKELWEGACLVAGLRLFLRIVIVRSLLRLGGEPAHHRFEFGLLLLSNRLGCHLHLQSPTRVFKVPLDGFRGHRESLDPRVLVQGHRRHVVARRRREPHLDGTELRGARFSGVQGIPDGLDPLFREAGDLDVRPHLHGLRCQAAVDVLRDLVPEHVGDLQLLEGICLPRERQLEGVVAVAVLAIQRPAHLLVQLLEEHPLLLGHLTQDHVHGLGLLVALVALGDVLRRHSALGEVDVALLLVDSKHHDALGACMQAR